MRIPLTKYGGKQMAIGVVVTLAATIALAIYLPWLAPVTAILLLWVLYFFRDPQRVIPDGEGVVVSPADGKITEITECDEDEFIGGPALKIGIFLSVFNVHINRAPFAGQVAYLSYHRGEFGNAMSADSSHRNENNCIGLETEGERPMKLLVKQIAGLIARRIVCRCEIGDRLGRGQQFGMIKFGSRTELFIPKDLAFELSVEVGQTVAAGKTIMGTIQ